MSHGAGFFLNFFSMGSIIATVFNIAVVIVFLFMPKKDKATIRFMLVYLFISIQNIGYVITSLWYHPLGAYHRWLTVPAVFLGLIYMTQFFFYYPIERRVGLARAILVIQLTVSAAMTVLFISGTVHAEKVFRFDGHYWDFNVDPLSYLVSLIILIYIVVVNIVALWRVFVTRGRFRWYVLAMMGSFVVIGIVPGIINALSREGTVDRETFQIIWNLITVLGFFLAVTVYINITRSRTTVMTNVVGICFVTFLLLFQGLSFFISREREKSYDELHHQLIERKLADKKYQPPGLRYLRRVSEREESVLPGSEIDESDDIKWRAEVLNTILYEEILSIQDENFEKRLMGLCARAHDYFEGYGRSLENYFRHVPVNQPDDQKLLFRRYSYQLNRLSRYHCKKIHELKGEGFNQSLLAYLEKTDEDFCFFRDALLKYIKRVHENNDTLIDTVDGYLAPFRGSGQRIYRMTEGGNHHVSFIHLLPGKKAAIEAGFSYFDYRRYIHESTIHLLYLLGAVIIVLLVPFPLFFFGALIRPMRELLNGMRMVNSGNLEVAVPIRLKDEIGFLTHSFNVMVRSVKNTNREIDNINHYLKNIIDSMPSILVSVDSKGRISHWNMAAEKKTGFMEDDVMGRYLWDIMPQFDQYVKNMMNSIEKREPQKLESIVHLENNEIRYSDMMVYPLIANGIEGAVIRIDDITLRRRLEEMMIQTEKMMSVGGLAAGMAHEINNPLSGMLLAAQNISRRLSPDFESNREAADKCGITFNGLQSYIKVRDIAKMLEDMKEMGERASMIVNNMLSFSRQSESKMTATDIAQLLIKTVDLAASEYDLKKSYDFRHIEIVREFDGSVPAVECIAVEIQQVILNLLKNAAHAMHLKKYAPDESPRITLRVNRQSEWVVIEVEDNGPGMSDEHRKRVFEPFFTTKEAGKGTGLGLSVSYFIITDNHRGRMEVESMIGKGTRFIIRLPISR